MYSIGKLSREFKLSRSTLLYYDSIGLLIPSGRTESNYRVYSTKDRDRLEKICTFREAGVSLEDIKELLDSQEYNEKRILEKRLINLNSEIKMLRLQQRVIIEMLKKKGDDSKYEVLDKKIFVNILKSLGLDEETLNNMHTQFESIAPDGHQAFLEFLGIDPEEISNLRKMSKKHSSKMK